jgi:hypothetical protein
MIMPRPGYVDTLVAESHLRYGLERQHDDKGLTAADVVSSLHRINTEPRGSDLPYAD